MKERIDRAPNWHHTLYYKRNYERFSHTYQWREHPVMLVPLPFYDHVDLHNAVLPVDTLPSRDLTLLALGRCAAIYAQSGTLTRLEAFMDVRDELRQYHQYNKVSELGREALKFSEQFSRQLEFMSEVPVLGGQWVHVWTDQQRQRVAERLLLLQTNEQQKGSDNAETDSGDGK